MSFEFQRTLKGNPRNTPTGTFDYSYSAVPFGSYISLQHYWSNAYLSSDTANYPNSKYPQVAADIHTTGNIHWEIVPMISKQYVDPYEPDQEETKKGYRYLRHHSYIRLRHHMTGKFLATHQVRASVNSQNIQITTLAEQDCVSRFDDTIWQVLSSNPDSKVISAQDTIMIASVKHQVVLTSHPSVLLPNWGKNLQEVSGTTEIANTINYWRIIHVSHEKIVDGIQLNSNQRCRSRRDATSHNSQDIILGYHL